VRLSIVAAVIGFAVAPPALAGVTISTKPRLEPRFRPGAPDYVSRCKQGAPLAVTVHASGGDRASVAGGPEHAGTFVTNVSRRTGEALSIKVRTQAGTVTHYHVRCLPSDFPTWTIERHGKSQAEWYITTPDQPGHGYAAIFDAHGAPVWWRRPNTTSFIPWDAKLLDDGLLVLGHNLGDPFGVRAASGFDERTLNDKVVRQIHTHGSPTDVHDLEQLPNGHFLAITYRRRDGVDLSAYQGPKNARVFYGEIQELGPRGHLFWRWTSRGHISPSETERAWWYNPQPGHEPPPAVRGYDLLHTNSVAPDGDGLVVSGRHLDAVFHIKRPSGDVDWKLGGTYVPGRSLNVIGVPANQPVLGGQHDARVLPDGTVTVYNNQTDSGLQPSADRFRINPVARTATRIEHILEPDVPRSRWGGSARRLTGGDWVVSWGGTNLITEQTGTGAVVLALRLQEGYFSYRAQPLEPGHLSASDLRHGMNAMAAASSAAASR
jgi:arylsulfotransferase ASST